MNRFLLLLSVLVIGSASAQTPVIYDAIGFNSYDALFVKVRKEGRNYFCHPVTGMLVDGVEDHAGELIVVVKDGAYGVINADGKLLAGFDYDEVKLMTHYDGQWYNGIRYNYQFAQLKKDGKYGLVDQHGRIIAEPRFQELSVINKDVIGFRENDKWGWLRAADGKIVQQPLYDELARSYLFEHTLEIYLNGKKGIAHENGELLIRPVNDRLDNIFLRSRKYAHFFKGKNSGLMDSTGAIVLPAVYETLIPCRGSDFLQVQEAERHGLIDVTGKEITPALYDKIHDFVRGRAIVEKAGRMGVIDESGALLLSPQYNEIEFRNSSGQVAFGSPVVADLDPVSSPSKEYLNRKAAEDKMKALPYYLWVKNHEHKTGVFDWKGVKVIVPEKFSEISTLYQQGETYFHAVLGNLYAVYDKQGNELLPLKYRLQTDIYINRGYNYGELNTSPYIFPVYDDKRLGLYDVQKKKFIIPVSDVEISWLNERCFEVRRNVEGVSYTKESAVYDIDGALLIPYSRDIYQLKMLSEQLLLAEMESQYVVFDIKGRTVYERADWNRNGYYSGYNMPEYDNKGDKPFESGLFKIRIKEGNLFIDEKGKEVRFTGFTYVSEFWDNLAWAVKETGDKVRYGLIDIKGNVVLEPQYDRLDAINDHPNLVMVRKNGKYGVLDRQGKLILEPVYDTINTFSPELLEVTLKGKVGLTDNNGKMVIEPRFDNISRNYSGIKRTWPVLVQEGNDFAFMNEGGRPSLIRGKSKIY